MQPVAGSTIQLTTTVKVGGILTNAAAIEFKWKMGLWGEEVSVTPSLVTTGTYRVSITPLEGGNLYYRWDTEGALDTAKEGVIAVRDTQFDI